MMTTNPETHETEDERIERLMKEWDVNRKLREWLADESHLLEIFTDA